MSRFEEIRQRCDAASPGPWSAEPKPAEKGVFIPQAAAKVAANGDWHQAKFNAWFIAHAREDIPFLLKELEQVQQELEEKESKELDFIADCEFEIKRIHDKFQAEKEVLQQQVNKLQAEKDTLWSWL